MRAMKSERCRCPISHGSQVASYVCSLRMSNRSSDLRPSEATLRNTSAAPAVEPVRTLMRSRGADLVELSRYATRFGADPNTPREEFPSLFLWNRDAAYVAGLDP